MPGSRAAIEQRSAEAVADYVTHHRPEAARELDFYRGIPTLSRAICLAARARTAAAETPPPVA